MTESVNYIDLEGTVRAYKIDEDIIIELLDSAPKLDESLKSTVDQMWYEALNRDDRHLFDGTVLSVVDIKPQRITVCRKPYRHFYAQTIAPDLFQHIGARPLACSGVLRCLDGLLFARRAKDVFLDPGRWELAPSGTLDTEAIDYNGRIDAAGFLMREMHEELGIEPSSANPGRIVGLFEMMPLHSLDLAIKLQLNLTNDEVTTLFEKNNNQEYSALAVIPNDGIGAFVTQNDSNFVALTLRLLEHLDLN